MRRARFWPITALVMALAVITMLPSMGIATTVDLENLGVANSFPVNVDMPGFGALNVLAGNYRFGISAPSGSGNPFDEFLGFCVESAELSDLTLVYERLNIQSNTPLAAAAWILSQNYTTMAPEAQVAVWKLTISGFSYNSGFDATQLGQMNMIYNNALTHWDFNTADFALYRNPVGSDEVEYSQNFIGPNVVPIPSAALLLGSGLLGLVGLNWRRRKADA